MSTIISRPSPAAQASAAAEEDHWSTILADPVTDPAELCRLVGLSPSVAGAAGRAKSDFPLLVPRTYLARIRLGDPRDPLLLQVLPKEHELDHPPEFMPNPLGEAGKSVRFLREAFHVDATELQAGCCGLAGTFGMQKKNAELSAKISKGLKDALDSNPCKNVLTECAACKMQIEHISGKTVSHPIKIIAQAYKK